VGLSFVSNFLQLLVVVVWALVFGRVLMSWFDPTGRNQISAFLIQTTEPLLGPVRRMLPATGMVDWSGMVVLIGLSLLMRAF
jgi:YggT family protein